MIEIAKKTPHHLHFKCSSEFEHLDTIVDKTEAFLAPLLTDDELAYRVVLLLTEAVTNAIEHGNENDISKMVIIDLQVEKKQILVQVEDEGQGFDPSAISNPVATENLLNDGGRGIFFIEEMADAVTYEQGGRRVCITFNRP